MTPISRAVLEDRKVHPVEKKDILSMMLEGRDKETGLGMSQENIKYNVCCPPFSSAIYPTYIDNSF